ncbi:anti-anti-sigma regulatory factor [Bacillus tianshenii]|uniref:Anti-anti-sigma regulatory factor n=1 Tax=Sutcliffiella tianshenii TaxID=1463404 RepID=A0ABS2NYI6_9BACI|nr:STAS domain-containing protein [Bacillus tianshenii]MBM7619741.1 anti-anti-sigma regulatory factor [Bacillus tianshenii]
MKVKFNRNSELTNFIKDNQANFEAKLLSEAVNVAGKINDILNTGNIDLLKNAQNLAIFVVEEREEELIGFARQEGVLWAQHSLTLSFKLEWVQAIRRTLWHFLEKYDKFNEKNFSREDFFELERKVNDSIDSFINNFFLSYSEYKDELLNSQRKIVEHLSVPIIPVSPTVAVLPLIGTIDDYRMQTIEEKVLMDISRLKLETLIMDLSGLTNMDEDVIVHFENILSGVSMMGCKAVITGLRAELVRNMIRLGVTFNQYAETHGTLQQTLKKYLAL